MGILDHRRTWHFMTTLTPEQCLAEFARAMSGSANGGLLSARWRIDTAGSSDGSRRANAVYEGRAGVAELATVLSRHATAESQAARGSTIRFEAAPVDGGRTNASMWLGSRTTIMFFFTADARFLRAYMHRVRRQLERSDPTLRLTKV